MVSRQIDECYRLSTPVIHYHYSYRAQTLSFWSLCDITSFTRLDTSKRLGQIATNPWGRRPSGTPYIGGWNVPPGSSSQMTSFQRQARRRAGRRGPDLIEQSSHRTLDRWPTRTWTGATRCSPG